MTHPILIENGAELNTLPHFEITSLILGTCFEIMNELGTGFLESVYKNALYFSLKEHGLSVEVEKPFEISYRGQKIGYYKADLVVDNVVNVELKCCECLAAEHQAQVINYLKCGNLPVGLLVNFGNARLEYKRLYHPSIFPKI